MNVEIKDQINQENIKLWRLRSKYSKAQRKVKILWLMI